MEQDDVIIVGSIGGPFGVRGWVHVKSFTQPSANLAQYRPWLLQINNHWQERHPSHVRPHGKGLVACFAGVSDREQAAAMAGISLGVAREVLPETEAGEYYWRDLQGLEVFNQAGLGLGKVAGFMDIGPHVVLVVAGDGDETLIPFVAQHVTRVDLELGRIEVDWDEPE